MPASLVNTIWDANPAMGGGGVRTAWDTPVSTSPTGIPVGGVFATNTATGPTGGYGYGYDPYGGGGSAATLGENTAKSNIAAAPDITKLTELVNALNAQNQTMLNQSRLGPQGQQIQQNLLTNTERQSAGLLDPQTEAMLRQGIAQGGVASGMGVDSPNLAASYRRALGQTIEGTEAQAQKQYLDLLAANPSAPLYNAGESLVTPGVYSSTASAQAERQLRQELAALAAQVNAQNNYRGGGGGGLDLQSLIPQSTRDMSWFYAKPTTSQNYPAPLTDRAASDPNLSYDYDYGYDPSLYDWQQDPIYWGGNAPSESDWGDMFGY